MTAAASAQSGNFCIVRTPELQGSYSGDCEGGIANGRGRGSGTDRYEGQFREGHPSGPGVYTYADGRRIDGEFVAGRVQGPARMVYPQGEVLEGEFRDGFLFGTSRLIRPGGEVQAVRLQSGALVVVGAAVPAPAPSPTPAVGPLPAGNDRRRPSAASACGWKC